MEKFDKIIEKVLDELSDSIEYAESYISDLNLYLWICVEI